jgi:hypothetical protein
MLDTLTDEQKALYNKLLQERRLLEKQVKDLYTKCISFDKELTEYELKYKEKIASAGDRLTIKTKLIGLCDEYLAEVKRSKEVNEEISKIHSQLTDNLIDPKFDDLWINKGVAFEERKKLFDAIRKDDNVIDLVNVSPLFKSFYESQGLD